MDLFIIILIGISLSMDAFSLALAYGTYDNNRNKIILPIIVGIYHFVMPLIGNWLGTEIMNYIPIKTNIIVGMVLIIIGIEMIIESLKEEKKLKKMNIIELLLFGLAVSIDSFSIGIGLESLYSMPIIPAIIFSMLSSLFTYIGLILGNRINLIFGKISTVIGGIVLITIGVLNM